MSGISAMMTCPNCGKKWTEHLEGKKICPKCNHEFDDVELSQYQKKEKPKKK
jgi:uncharacterized Zn ribbon protein